MGRAIWRIGWNKQGPDYGDITVTLDAQEGTVLNMWLWSKDMEQNPGLPGKIDAELLLKDTKERIHRFYPAYEGQVKLDQDSLEKFKKGSSSPYMNNTLFFQRQKDGIPVAEQGIRKIIGASLQMEVCYVPNPFDSRTKNKADIVYIPKGPQLRSTTISR